MKKAFTLLEILIVIAIIALIAAMMFPAIQRAKNAQKAQEQAALDQYLGYPAFPSELKDKEVYEVVLGYHDTSSSDARYLTFLKGKDTQLRLYSLVRKFEPGFYRAFAGVLTPLKPSTLEKN